MSLQRVANEHLTRIKQEKANDNLILSHLDANDKIKGLKHSSKRNSVQVKTEKDAEHFKAKRFKPDASNNLSTKKVSGMTAAKSLQGHIPDLTKADNNIKAVTSTPNDKIQDATTNGIPGSPQKKHAVLPNKFVSKFFIQPKDLTPGGTLELEDDDDDDTVAQENSSSPCKNIKQVNKGSVASSCGSGAPVSGTIFDTNGTTTGVVPQRRTSKGVPHTGNGKFLEKPVPPVSVHYPVFGDVLIETFQEEDLRHFLQPDVSNMNSNEIDKFSRLSFDDWAIQGLRVSSQYHTIIKKLIVYRLSFASQVNNLKKEIDCYGLALQDQKNKLEEKSSNLQQLGKKFVEEAKSF